MNANKKDSNKLKSIYITKFEDNILGSKNHKAALQYSEILNKPVFSFKDASEQSDEMTYRKLNDWDNKGLLESHRKEEKKGWRKFSIKDVIRLRIIKDLKLYGLSNDRIKNALQSVFESSSETKYNLFEYFFFETFLQNQKILLIVWNNGDSYFYSEMQFATLLGADFNESKPILILPFYDYVRPFTRQLLKKDDEFDESSTVWELINSTPDTKVKAIFEFINNEDYSEIIVQKKNDNLVIKPKRKGNNISEDELIHMIKEKDFQNIELKIQNGKIVSLSREEIEKIAI